MVKIKHNLNNTQDRKKTYVYKGKEHSEFRVDEHVFLEVKEKWSSLKLGSCQKLVVRYCGPFEVMERISPIAYMFSLSSSMRVRNVFYVSLSKK
jgi:hypothetical protein